MTDRDISQQRGIGDKALQGLVLLKMAPGAGLDLRTEGRRAAHLRFGPLPRHHGQTHKRPQVSASGKLHLRQCSTSPATRL